MARANSFRRGSPRGWKFNAYRLRVMEALRDKGLMSYDLHEVISSDENKSWEIINRLYRDGDLLQLKDGRFIWRKVQD